MQHPLSVFGAGFSHMCCAEVRRTLARLPLHAICGSRIRRRPSCRKRLAVLPVGGTVSSAKSVQSSLLNALSGGGLDHGRAFQNLHYKKGMAAVGGLGCPLGPACRTSLQQFNLSRQSGQSLRFQAERDGQQTPMEINHPFGVQGRMSRPFPLIAPQQTLDNGYFLQSKCSLVGTLIVWGWGVHSKL